jgi:hypothetical protein
MHIKNKKFNRDLMHPTRKKLAKMVATGEYEVDPKIGYTTASVKREVGDEWTDSNGDTWKQMDFGKVKMSALSDVMKEVREYLRETTMCSDRKNGVCDCKDKMSHADKKLIAKTGFCATALGKRELPIKVDGLWDAYNQYRMAMNAIAHGNDILQKYHEAYREAKQEYEVVHKDGRLDKWTMDIPVEQLKAEILESISRIESEIVELSQIRDDSYALLKDKNYELVQMLNV